MYPTNLDPCCGGSLEKATKFIAMLEITFSAATACVIWFLILITLFYQPQIQEAAEQDRNELPGFADLYDMGTPLVVFFLLLLMGLYMMYILLGRMLLHGVKERNHDKVHRWYVITLVLVVVRLVFFFVGAAVSSDVVAMPLFALLGLTYQLYCLWVVRVYKKELTSGEYTHLRQTYNVVHKL